MSGKELYRILCDTRQDDFLSMTTDEDLQKYIMTFLGAELRKASNPESFIGNIEDPELY
jgi:hypothetical protein